MTKISSWHFRHLLYVVLLKEACKSKVMGTPGPPLATPMLLFYWKLDEMLLSMCFSVFNLNPTHMYLLSFEHVQSFIVNNPVKSNQGAFLTQCTHQGRRDLRKGGCMSRDIQSISLVLLLLLVIKAVTHNHSLRLFCFSKIAKITTHLFLGLPSAFAVQFFD